LKFVLAHDKDQSMKRSRFSEEQIIGILKEHEAGVSVADLCRKHGVSDAGAGGGSAPGKSNGHYRPGGSTKEAIAVMRDIIRWSDFLSGLRVESDRQPLGMAKSWPGKTKGAQLAYAAGASAPSGPNSFRNKVA